MKVRQKPVIVDAWKFDISNVDEIITMYERIFNTKVKSMLEVTTLMQGVTNTKGIPVPTPNDISFLYDGDWLIQGVNGEFYTCKPDVFEKTYEVVDEIS